LELHLCVQLWNSDQGKAAVTQEKNALDVSSTSSSIAQGFWTTVELLQSNCLYFQPRWFQVTVYQPIRFVFFAHGWGAPPPSRAQLCLMRHRLWLRSAWPTPWASEMRPIVVAQPSWCPQTSASLLPPSSPEGYHQIHVSGLGNSLGWPHMQVSVVLEEWSSILSTC